MDKTENKKTIEHLNSRAWYRAIKVVYILFGLVVFASIITLFSLGEFKMLDIPNSVVICQYGQYGNDKQLLIKDIFNKDEIPTTIPNYFNVKGTNLSEKILMSCGINAVITGDPYRIKQKDKIQFGYMLLVLLMALVVFETIKRIFYYIVLGTINPKK